MLMLLLTVTWIDETRYIATRTNTTIIRISKSSLYETVLESEIQIPEYQFLKSGRNRNSGGIVCYIRIDIGYIQKHFFPKEIESIFVEVLLPETKPIIVAIIYRTSY